MGPILPDSPIFTSNTGGAPNRTGGGSAESSPYFTRRHYSHNKPLERYQSCMTLPSEGLVDPLDRLRDRARTEGEERRVSTGGGDPASPRSVSSAPCGLQDHHTGTSRLGLALPLGLTHSSPTASPQRMEWKVNGISNGSEHVETYGTVLKRLSLGHHRVTKGFFINPCNHR